MKRILSIIMVTLLSVVSAFANIAEGVSGDCKWVIDNDGNLTIFSESYDVAKLGTWEGENLSLTSGMLKGIAQIIHAYGESLNEEIFKDHVGRVTPKAISRTAHDRHPGTIGFAEALILAYNKATKKRLSLQKLYWSNSKRKGAAPPDYEAE